MLYMFLGMLIVALIVVSISAAILIKRNKELHSNLKLSRDQNESASSRIQELNNCLIEKGREYAEISRENSKLQEQLHAVDLLELKTENDTAVVEERQRLLNELNDNIAVTRTELDTVSETRRKLVDELDKLKDDRNVMETTIKEREAAINEMERRFDEKSHEVDELVEKFEKVKQELADAMSLQKKSYQDVGNVGDGITLSDREARLISLLKEIASNYTDLSGDLATLAWRKVWLPKMQSICKGWSGVSGIYMLTLKSDEKVKYVGQAVDIKERWYTHAKKMIGADPSGNEKLYRDGWMPSDFKWAVIEQVEDNKIAVDDGSGTTTQMDVNDYHDGGLKGWLNDRERWWIEWFGCVEIGLNGR